MKIAICEICYYKSDMKKLVKATMKVGFKNNAPTLVSAAVTGLKIDTCDKHQNIISEEKITFEKMDEWYNTLRFGSLKNGK